MKFYEILCFLNSKNIFSLFSLLKKSSCRHSKNILLHLTLGNNIFQACSIEFGGIVEIILLNKNLESLNFAGQYLKLRYKINEKITMILIYPFVLLILLIIIIIFLRRMKFFFSLWFFLSPLLIVICITFSVLYLKRLLKTFILHYILVLLFSNKMNLKSMNAILRYLEIDITHLFKECTSPQDISNLLVKKSINSREAAQEEFEIFQQKVISFISLLPQLLYGTSMLVITIILLGVVLSIFNSQKNMLEYFV